MALFAHSHSSHRVIDLSGAPGNTAPSATTSVRAGPLDRRLRESTARPDELCPGDEPVDASADELELLDDVSELDGVPDGDSSTLSEPTEVEELPSRSDKGLDERCSEAILVYFRT